MGKIYRVPIPKRLGLIDLRNRRHVILYGIGLILVTIVVGYSVGSSLTDFAVELLAIGLLMIFFLGLFWEDWSTQTTQIIVLLSAILILTCLFIAAARVITIFDPELGIEALATSRDTRVRENPIFLFPELLPMFIPICAFVLCARGALVEEYESDG